MALYEPLKRAILKRFLHIFCTFLHLFRAFFGNKMKKRDRVTEDLFYVLRLGGKGKRKLL